MRPAVFTGKLVRPEGVGTWTYVDIPLEVSATFGAKGQVRVKGVVNGVPFHSTALPHGDGRHYVVINKALRDAAGVTAGDSVELELEPDLEVRTIELPADLAESLTDNPEARAAFEKLSYSHRKEYVDWIIAAKQAVTRQNRIARALGMLLEGKTPKSRQ